MIVTASDLRAQFGGISMHFKWMGVSIKASNAEKTEIAHQLGANVKALKIEKVLIDTGNKDYQRLTRIRSQLKKKLDDETLPYVEKGVRLMDKTRLENFVYEEFNPRRTSLAVAVENLADKWLTIIAEAPQMLGKLHSAGDYPLSPLGLFDVTLSFPNLEPPGHLPPGVFLKQSEEVTKKFEQALKMKEALLTEELKRLVDNLAGKLVPDGEGKYQKFKSASVENVYEFFEEVKKLGFGSSEDLIAQIQKVENLMGGITAQDLKDLTDDGKSSLSQAFKEISTSLEGSLESLPRRKFKLGNKKKYDAAA